MYLMGNRQGNSQARKIAALALVALAVVIAAMTVAGPVRAQTAELSEQEVFTIRGVPVDVTAATASDARRLALADGQTEALRRMLRRLTRRVDHAALPAVGGEAREFLVQGLEVANEKTSSVRYLADLSVRFKPVEVRRLLRQTGLPFAETASRPLLVLPVLKTPDGLTLWDATNRWRTAWTALPIRRGLVPVIVPFGDLTDIAAIDAAQAMLGDPEALGAIAGRYATDGILVALATLSVRDDGVFLLDIAASRPTDEATPPLLLSFTVESADLLDSVLRTAAAETAAGVEDAWLDSHLLRFDSLQSIALVVPVDGIEQWASVERKLQSVVEISRVQLRVLRRNFVEIQIDFYGGERQLTAALGRRDLELEPAVPSVAVSVDRGMAVSAESVGATRLRVLRPRGS